MTHGRLSELFNSFAIKKISSVESTNGSSNQHELNGVHSLRAMLGESEDAIHYDAKMIYMGDEEDPIIEKAKLSWYDARKVAREERGVNRSEYRLYYPSNEVSSRLGPGDVLVVAKLHDDSLIFIVAKAESSSASQIEYIFGQTSNGRAKIKLEAQVDREALNFTSKKILETIGFETFKPEESFIEKIINKFGERFPSTLEFSNFSRSLCNEISPIDNPDEALISWVEKEEVLFRTLEKHILQNELSSEIFLPSGTLDVDKFIDLSLSIQNRRKSRAGKSLEHHVAAALTANNVKFERNAVTENKSKPDFLFPSQSCYQDKDFPENILMMLGVKSTCKDRWRQVLSEAERIKKKHLLTLEAPISKNQTNEMQAKNLKLVIPSPLIDRFTSEQRNEIINFGDFIKTAKQSPIF